MLPRQTQRFRRLALSSEAEQIDCNFLDLKFRQHWIRHAFDTVRLLACAHQKAAHRIDGGRRTSRYRPKRRSGRIQRGRIRLVRGDDVAIGAQHNRQTMTLAHTVISADGLGQSQETGRANNKNKCCGGSHCSQKIEIYCPQTIEGAA